jgi:hypothetical protein
VNEPSDFEMALEHLRQVSRVYLPKMAEEYRGAAEVMTRYLPYESGSYASSGGFFETADFLKGEGGEAMCGNWMRLADLFIATLGHASSTYWYTGQVLDWALDCFVETDNANADDLDDLRDKAEDSGIEKEFTGEYEPVEVPDYEDPRK